jgi:hypothetical protein
LNQFPCQEAVSISATLGESDFGLLSASAAALV